MRSADTSSSWAKTSPARPVASALDRLPATTSATALAWACLASTVYRMRRGEGVLLAINVSLAVHDGFDGPRALARVLVSVLAMLAMYAFNDLYDAPLDAANPKKDRALIATYLEYRGPAAVAIACLKLVTVAIALVTLGAGATVAVTAAFIVNVVYSTVLKGVPVMDVAWCAVWGAAYAAIVTSSPALLVVVGLMTGVCHLYQTLDDRGADATNAITTTAVHSAGLARGVLVALAALLWCAVRGPLGDAWALTAFMPVAFYFLFADARIGWLLTKVCFGVVWLALLGITRAGL